MNCKNCGSKINEEVKFCSSCGTDIKPVADKQKKAPLVEENKSTSAKNVLNQIVSFASIVGGFILGKYLGLALLLFVLAWFIGQWFAKWYLKRERINITLINWIVWSNVVTWLLPPLGVMTGFATLEFSNHFPNNTKKYETIAVIALIVSFINALSGVIMNM